MKFEKGFKIRSLDELYDLLPENELIITDILRQLIIETLPDYCKEKISYNVPFFSGRKSLCLVWPSTIPRSGFKQGVTLAFWYGHLLPDTDQYLEHGTNKQIYWKNYFKPEDIDQKAVIKVLKQAIELDRSW